MSAVNASNPAIAIKRTIIYALLILFFLGLSIISFRWSLADILATQVDYHLDTVDEASTNKNAEAWRKISLQLQRCLSLRDNAPRYLESAERFYQMLDTLETDAPELLKELGWKDNEQKALGFTRRSLQFRPSWPYLWEEMALSKAGLKEFDDELTGSFERAIKLGLWEQSIMNDLTWIGLDSWDNLAKQAQHLVFQAIEQSLVIGLGKSHFEQQLPAHTNFIKICAMIRGESISKWALLERMCLSDSVMDKQ